VYATVPVTPLAASLKLSMTSAASNASSSPLRVKLAVTEDVEATTFAATACVQKLPMSDSWLRIVKPVDSEYAPLMPVLLSIAAKTTSAACASVPLAIVYGDVVSTALVLMSTGDTSAPVTSTSDRTANEAPLKVMVAVWLAPPVPPMHR